MKKEAELNFFGIQIPWLGTKRPDVPAAHQSMQSASDQTQLPPEVKREINKLISQQVSTPSSYKPSDYGLPQGFWGGPVSSLHYISYVANRLGKAVGKLVPQIDEATENTSKVIGIVNDLLSKANKTVEGTGEILNKLSMSDILKALGKPLIISGLVTTIPSLLASSLTSLATRPFVGMGYSRRGSMGDLSPYEYAKMQHDIEQRQSMLDNLSRFTGVGGMLLGLMLLFNRGKVFNWLKQKLPDQSEVLEKAQQFVEDWLTAPYNLFKSVGKK